MIINHILTGNEPEWPSTLPDCYLVQGFKYAPHNEHIRSPMDTGIGKVRPRYTAEPWRLSGSIVVTTAQIKILNVFHKDTLVNGTLVFKKTDPLNPARQLLWRFAGELEYAVYSPDKYITPIILDYVPGNEAAQPPPEFSLVDAAGHHLTDQYGNWLADNS